MNSESDSSNDLEVDEVSMQAQGEEPRFKLEIADKDLEANLNDYSRRGFTSGIRSRSWDGATKSN